MSDEIKFCRNCGKELKEGASFCSNCGAQIAKVVTNGTKTPDDENISKNATSANKPRSTVKTIGIIIAAVFGTLFLIFLIGVFFGSTSVNSDTKVYSDSQIKSSAIEYNYDQLFKSPDTYKGKSVTQSGKVIQALYEGNSLTMRLATKMTDYGSYMENVMLVTYNGPKKVSDNDEIRVYGIYQGLNTYNTILGGRNTLPLLKATVIEPTVLVTKQQIDKDEADQYLVLNVDSVEDQSTKYSSKTVISGSLQNSHPNKILASAKLVGYFTDNSGIEIDSVSNYLSDLKPGQIREFSITSYKDSDRIKKGYVEIASSRFN
ncbi:MAG: zinc-ribbon domain-containing protein [Crenarchaeota archaeon]|nr:zinc-ribbon domain-containing protein [Thermoproteota archaeon]